MKIIIAEKPSVGRTYAEILGAKTKEDGYIEGNGWIVTWTIGHLVSLAYPEAYDDALKKWNLGTLPIVPDKYKYGVINNVKDQFNIVKGLYNEKISSPVEAIYYAGDSGREGLYIQMLVRMLAGHKSGIDERIVWIDSQTEAEVLRGIRDAKPVDDYKTQIDAGYLRAIEDWLVGINFTRALSCKYGKMINDGVKKYTPVTVGRVMTCVLGMIVDREQEILNFKPTPFFKIVSTINKDGQEIQSEWKVTDKSPLNGSPKLYETNGTNGFREEKDAEDFIKSLKNPITIQGVERKEEKKAAPLLFNLAELQSECSKKFHISPQETLDVAQRLYEAKVTTYPRTDARVLTTAIAGEIGKNLSGLSKNPEYKPYAEQISKSGSYKSLASSKYVDDSKVTDHYAIIPTGEDASSISGLDKDVYDLITRRFLAIFYPPAVYEKISLTEASGVEIFAVGGKILKSPGYMEVSGIPDTDETRIDMLKKITEIKPGESYTAEFSTVKGETKPPSRYTSGSMILAMENAGKLIEDEDLREQIKGSGIGTSATRAEVIEKLIRLEYVERNKKTQVLKPGELGGVVYEIVKATVPSLLSPKMTASWEKGLAGVEDGSISYDVFRQKLESYVKSTIEKIKGDDDSDEIRKNCADHGYQVKTQKTFGQETKFICPKCGGTLKTSKYGYVCEHWSKEEGEGCKFATSDSYFDNKIPEDKFVELMKNKSIEIELKGKNKSKYKATLLMDENGRITRKKAEETEPPVVSSLLCPKCSSALMHHQFNYKCACGFTCKHTIANKELTEEQMQQLFDNKETTDKITFHSSAKNKDFDAKVKMKKDGSLEFVFDTKKSTKREKK